MQTQSLQDWQQVRLYRLSQGLIDDIVSRVCHVVATDTIKWHSDPKREANSCYILNLFLFFRICP